MSAVLASFAVCVLLFATYQWSKHRERGREDERRKLRAYVQDLPGWQPTLLIMHVEDRYNYLEIAAKLEMPAQFVLAELARAYATLRVRELENEPAHKSRWLRYRAVLIYKLLGG